MNYLFYFIGAFVLSTIIMPIVIKLGEKYIIDLPDKRKLHVEPKPRSGGIGILLAGFLLVIISPVEIKLLMPLIIIFIVGLLDDLFDIKAMYKFIAQILVAFIAYYSGIRIHQLYVFGFNIALGYLSLPFTVIWLTFIMNAFNLIDGLDGLAATLFLISSLFLSILSLIYTHNNLLLALVIITGATLGFLRYNLHPAKVFLGDAGSLSLGFIIAVATANLVTSRHNIDFFGILLVIFVPLLDTVWTTIRRIKDQKPLFKADNGHIHHIIIEALNSEKLTLYIIGSWSYIIGVLGLIYNITSSVHSKLLILFLTFTSTLFFYNLLKIKAFFGFIYLPVTKKQDDLSS